MANLAKLKVLLEAESSKLRSELEKTNRKLSQFSKRAQKTANGISSAFKGIVITAAVAGTVAAFKKLIDQADELSKLSTRLGAPVEELSRLQHAADLTDVSFQTLGKSMAKASRNISEAATGTGEALTAFQDLGVSAEKLKALRPDQQFAILADALKEVDNQSKKIEIVQKIFGRGGNELLTLLDEGSAGLRKMGEESDRLGKTVSTKLAKSSEQFNDNLTRMQGALFGVANEIVENVLPQFSDMSDDLVKGLPDAVAVALIALRTLVLGFRVVSAAGTKLQSKFKNLAADIGEALGLEAGPRLLRQQAEENAKEAGAAIDVLIDKAEALKASVDNLGKGSQALVKKLEPAKGSTLADVRGDTLGLADKKKALEIDKEALKLKQRSEQLTAQFRTDSEKFIQIDNELADLLARKAISQDTYNRALADANIQYTVLGKVEEARTNVLESLTTKQDEYNQAIADAKLAFDANAISAEQYATAVANAFNKLKEKTEEVNEGLKITEEFAAQAARNIQDSFADFLFDPFEDGLKGMLGNLADTLRRMAAEILANAALKAALEYLGSIGGSSSSGTGGAVSGIISAALGAIGGGTAADGARVKAGQPFLVGERGPELFIPNTQGVIEPNAARMGGETTVNVTVNGIRDEGGLRATANQIAGQAGSAVQRARQRNG